MGMAYLALVNKVMNMYDMILLRSKEDLRYHHHIPCNAMKKGPVSGMFTFCQAPLTPPMVRSQLVTPRALSKPTLTRSVE